MGYRQGCHKIRREKGFLQTKFKQASEFTKEDKEIQSEVGQINYERNRKKRNGNVKKENKTINYQRNNR